MPEKLLRDAVVFFLTSVRTVLKLPKCDRMVVLWQWHTFRGVGEGTECLTIHPFVDKRYLKYCLWRYVSAKSQMLDVLPFSDWEVDDWLYCFAEAWPLMTVLFLIVQWVGDNSGWVIVHSFSLVVKTRRCCCCITFDFSLVIVFTKTIVKHVLPFLIARGKNL